MNAYTHNGKTSPIIGGNSMNRLMDKFEAMMNKMGIRKTDESEERKWLLKNAKFIAERAIANGIATMPKKKTTIDTCVVCKKAFGKVVANQITCSKECSNKRKKASWGRKYEKAGTEKVCKHCKNTFRGRHKSVTCSKKCDAAYKKVAIKERTDNRALRNRKAFDKFNDIIVAYKDKTNMSFKQISTMLGYDKRKISKWRNGHHTLKEDDKKKILSLK